MAILSRRISLILLAVVVVVLGGFILERLLTTVPSRPFGHTQWAHLVGWAGMVVIGFTFVYPYKRWRHPNQVWPKRWFQVHIICGLVGPGIIFVHSGAHFHAWVPILALIAMILVVLSGITGQAVHYLAFRTLYEKRHELTSQGMSEQEVEGRLHDLALEEETLRWWKCVHGPITWSFVILTLLHIGGAVFFGGA